MSNVHLFYCTSWHAVSLQQWCCVVMIAGVWRETVDSIWPPPQWKPLWSPHPWGHPQLFFKDWSILPPHTTGEYINGHVTCRHRKPRLVQVPKFRQGPSSGMFPQTRRRTLYACLLVAWSPVLPWSYREKEPSSQLLVGTSSILSCTMAVSFFLYRYEPVMIKEFPCPECRLHFNLFNRDLLRQFSWLIHDDINYCTFCVGA